MAPSPSVRSGYGTISARSYSSVAPKPLQVGQAPLGLLNENSWGDGTGAMWPSLGHWKRVVNFRDGGWRTADDSARATVCSASSVSVSAVRRPPSAVRGDAAPAPPTDA